jgi:cell division protein FtsA
VRLAQPEELRGLVDRLQSPAFSTSLGLLQWARLQEEQHAMDGYSYRGFTIPRLSIGRAADFLKRLLPG